MLVVPKLLIRYSSASVPVWPAEPQREHVVSAGFGDAALTDRTEQWLRVRWEVVRVLHLEGALHIDELKVFFDDEDHCFVGPAVGFHRTHGNITAQRVDGCLSVLYNLTPQGERLACSQ